MPSTRFAVHVMALGAAALAPAPVLAEGIAVAHTAAACVPSGRYLRVTASGTPSEAVVSAELQFRGSADGDWYAARMSPAAGGWTGFLPRPSRAGRLEYRIVMTGTDAATTATPVVAVPIEVECASGEAAVEVAAPIVVRVPAGAPPVPPVPPGFSPAGVVAEERKAQPRRTLAWVSGAAVAGAVIAAGTTGGERVPAESDIPSFSFEGTRPHVGAVVTLGALDMVALVRMSRRPSRPLDLDWSLVFQPRQSPPSICQVVMFGNFPDAQAELDLELTAPLVAAPACESRFETDVVRLVIFTNGAAVLDTTESMRFTFRR